jgi:cobalt-zinc-cadmium efflux system outer membrane protein
MRFILAACALATIAAVSRAQQTTPPPASRPDSLGPRDTAAANPAAVRAAVTSAAPLTLADSSPLGRELSGEQAARGAFAGGGRGDTAYADTLRLTRDQAVATALAHNPQVVVAREQTAEARAQRVQNVSIPDPAGTASINTQAGTPAYKPVGASLDLPFPDKFRLQYNIGTAGVRAAEYTYTAVRQQITSQTAQTYDTLRVALRHHTDLTESRALAADFLRKTEARYNAGTAAKLDVVRAQVDLGQADNDLLGNLRDIANARASLNRLLGRPLPAPVAPADSLAVPPPLPDLTAIEQHALDARPELSAARAQQAGAHATTSLAREYWLPDLVFGASADFGAPDQYISNRSLIWQYGVSFPLPVFFWQHSAGEIAQDRHHERELDASYRDLRASVDQDVRAAYATAATALQQLLYLRDQVLPAAREAFRIASVSYGLGGISALDVLDARRTLVAAESQYTDALSAADASQADLERAAAAPLSQFPTGVPNVR